MTTKANLAELEQEQSDYDKLVESQLKSNRETHINPSLTINENDGLPYCPPGWTQEGWQTYRESWQDNPFFMSPEQMEKNLESNEMLQALQVLKYEDEDSEETIKKMYKEGNEMFRDHYVKDKSNRFYIKRILEKYTECILLEPKDLEMKAKILSNRA